MCTCLLGAQIMLSTAADQRREKVGKESSWRSCDVLNYKANNHQPSLLHLKFLSSSAELFL